MAGGLEFSDAIRLPTPAGPFGARAAVSPIDPGHEHLVLTRGEPRAGGAVLLEVVAQRGVAAFLDAGERPLELERFRETADLIGAGILIYLRGGGLEWLEGGAEREGRDHLDRAARALVAEILVGLGATRICLVGGQADLAETLRSFRLQVVRLPAREGVGVPPEPLVADRMEGVAGAIFAHSGTCR